MKNRTGQSRHKLVNYLVEFVDSDYFQGEVAELRKKLNIPTQGLRIHQEVEDNLNKSYPSYNIFKLPKELEQKDAIKELNLALKEIGKKINIYSLDINYFLRVYILYNKKFINIISNELAQADLIEMQDFYELLNEYPTEFTVDKIKNLFEYYPIIIKLHPSTTQRDLIDFIKNNWEYIEYNLGEHRDKNSKLGKVKKKKTGIKERNQFIYEHRHLPRKEIMSLVTNTFGSDRTIDYGYIGKIISLENKKRKEV